MVIMDVMGEKRRTYDLPESLLEAFSEYCDEKGLVKKDAIATAVRILMESPPDLRDAAVTGAQKRIAEWFRAARENWTVSEVQRILRESNESQPESGRGSGQKADGTGR
jgi:hypothetical protein